MDIRFEHIELMSPPEREAFLQELAENDDASRDYATWLAISEFVRRVQERVLQDRSIVVLAALRRAGLDSALTELQRSRLDEEWPQIIEAFSDPSFLDDVLSRVAAEVADFDESWALREQHLRPFHPVTTVRHRHRPAVRTLWRASAVAAVLVFIGILLFVVRRDASWVSMEVAEGQVERIALIDGSAVRIIGPSVLEYRSSELESTRPQLIRLSGDAFFDVVPSDESFVVETPAARVAVRGTSFGVRSHRGRTDVVVASGSVSVSGRAGRDPGEMVRGGQSCFVLADQQPSRPVSVNLTRALAWANLFVFRGTLLSEIASTLSGHYAVDVLVDTSLVEKTITGTFDTDRELEDILDVIARAASAKVVATPTGFHLIPDTI